MAQVKRSYDSRRRHEQARRNRDAVLDAAERRFLTDGYGLTTIASVAGEAGVSAETVYKAFGGKAGLVTAIWERGLEGRGPVPAPQRSDEMKAREDDPRQIIRNWGQLTTEVAPRVAPILLLIRTAAASDPEMARMLALTDRQRLRRMRQNAETLTGHLKEGLSRNDAAEIMWTYSSPDLYDLLVIRRRWPIGRYGRFISEAMINALFG
jgi:AcrR family transcriptional regulator